MIYTVSAFAIWWGRLLRFAPPTITTAPGGVVISFPVVKNTATFPTPPF